MTDGISVYSLSGYQQRSSAWNRRRIEYEHCPPFAWVMLVYGLAMAGGAYVASRFGSIAGGWSAGVALLALLGTFIDRRFCGAEALERRIRRRQIARDRAWSSAAFRRPWPRWTTSAAREWTSTSACRRHPQSTKAARAGWSPDSTHRGSRAEYRIRQA